MIFQRYPLIWLLIKNNNLESAPQKLIIRNQQIDD